MKRSFATAASTLALAVCFSLPALSQEAEQASGLEDIVVTAQKREERLQDTPIAISAFSAAAMEKAGVTNVQQVSEMAPNVTFDFTSPISGASNAAAVFIRGIGQSDFALTTDAGVGTYVDGVYMSRSLGGVIDVLDVERIEILRGPQGTLFGRNTIGGAISITTKRPSSEFEGKVEATIGDAGRRHFRGSINLPIADTTALRIAVSSKDRNGYVRSRFGDDQRNLLATDRNFTLRGLNNLGNENRQAARAVLEHEFSETVRVSVSADISRVRENNAASILRGVTNSFTNGPIAFVYNTFEAPGVTIPGFADALYDNKWITGDRSTTYATGPNGTKINSWGLGLTIEWDATDSLTLKSITSYRDSDGFFNRDADGSPITLAHTRNYGYEHEQWSQELQLIGQAFEDRLKFAAGLYYFRETGSDPIIVEFPESFATLFQDTANIKNRSYAAYAQATFAVTEQFSLTAGGRYTKDKKRFLSDQYLILGTAAPFVFGAPAGTLVPLVPRNSLARRSFDNFSPRVSLDYKLDDTLVYASWSKGFKSGGFNLRYVQPRPGILPFSPEKVDTYELGIKWEGLDRRLRINAAGFYTDYKNIQVTIFENLGAPVTLNAGDAEIKGVEVEVQAAPVDGLELTASLGYLDAKYKTIRQSAAIIVAPEQRIDTSTELPNAPEWQVMLAAQYTASLGEHGSLEFRADWRYSSSVENDAQNSVFLAQDAYNTLNLSAGYTDPSDRWTLRVFVDNVTDERYIVSGDSNYGIGFHEANFNRPREWGATLSVNF
jgi:iron complex outermembrane recepter protein